MELTNVKISIGALLVIWAKGQIIGTSIGRGDDIEQLFDLGLITHESQAMGSIAGRYKLTDKGQSLVAKIINKMDESGVYIQESIYFDKKFIQ
jgi:uncharacterized protein YwgA